VLSAVAERRPALTALLAKWKAFGTTELAALNAKLAKAGQMAIAVR
jgi:hypothetical protein